MLSLHPLGSSHDREHFDCGSDPLNRYLRQAAKQHMDKGIAQTYVLIDEAAGAPVPILGFFTLSLCQVTAIDLPPHWARRLPREIPALRLGRLAVALEQQRAGFGARLLYGALKHAAAVHAAAGGIGLFVDAKDEVAAGYYRRFGFESLSSALRLFMPMATILQLTGRSQ